VCRAQLAELRLLTRGLSQLTRPSPPPALAAAISDALAIEAAALQRQPHLPFNIRLALWLRPRLMPYTVGSLASIILFVGMLSALRTSMMTFRDWDRASRQSDEAAYRIIDITSEGGYDLTKPVAPDVFAATRAPYAIESPSLNPRGALAALTRSQLHSHEQDDDDMVVVTDVFSNGSASLASVVQAPRDHRMLDEFQAALRQDAAFVPASFDRRPETMRVVFVVQKVKVDEQEF
jgi:ABC-type multidrug transport system fused ATPase/permease subunit